MADSTIGVLALQGAFAKHFQVLKSLNVNTLEVRRSIDLEQCDGLIIPGGESSTMLRQIDFGKLQGPLQQFAESKPLFGTCAGLIIMSRQADHLKYETLGLLDVSIQRNGFGRQIESRAHQVSIRLNSRKLYSYRAIFIRAPRIKDYSDAVEVLASYQDEPILVKQGFHLGATFHPELTDDPTVHSYFVDLVQSVQSGR